MGLMQIPRRVDYGLRAVIYLSSQDPTRCCSISEISRQQNVPRKFLEKIIADLMRRGLIRSKRGSSGGYTLARPPEQRRLHWRELARGVFGRRAATAPESAVAPEGQR